MDRGLREQPFVCTISVGSFVCVRKTKVIRHQKLHKYRYRLLTWYFFGAKLRFRYHVHRSYAPHGRGDFMTEILNYLNHNYQSATLSDAAEHFGYSVSHFSTLIKEATGRTFLQIIRDIKLNQACRTLQKTTLSIPAICELVGYETRSIL